MAQYDAFLSYSSRDGAWAEKLYYDLTHIGYKVFWDRRNLDVGSPWRDELLKDLSDSANLIQLWTDTNAGQSHWVTEEIARFDTLAAGHPQRRILSVGLEGANPRYTHLQGINLLDRAGQYNPALEDRGASDVDRRIWGQVIDLLDRALGKYVNRPYMFQVILASTQARMAGVPMNFKPAYDADDFQTILRNLKISRNYLLGHYGNERGDWVPFACGRSITSILSEIRDRLIGEGAPPFRWAFTGDRLWNSNSRSSYDFRMILKNLKEQPCVIVVDALSLYDQQVYDRNDWLQECVSNPYATIMILPPFAVRRRDRLRAALEHIAAEFYSSCYSPVFEAQLAPRSSSALLPADDLDVQRLLTAAVRTSKQSLKSWATSLSSEPL